MVNRPAVYNQHSGAALARHLAEKGLRIFTVDQVRSEVAAMGLKPTGVDVLLHRLERSGWLVRVRRGLYTLPSNVFQGNPLHEFETAMALARPAAISHWSALSLHGLTEQPPRTVFVLTTTQTDRRTTNLDGILYHFTRVAPHLFFGIQQVWVGESQVAVTDPERTLLDGLERPRLCGGFHEVLAAFERHLPSLQLDRLVQYGRRFSPATARRLGWILEVHLGLPSVHPQELLNPPIRGYRPLDPTGPRRGPCNTRWGVQVNLQGGAR